MTNKFDLPPNIIYQTGDTEPVTVPLVNRVGGADERIGYAVVKIENGDLKVIGISMLESGIKLLDLGMVLIHEDNPLMDAGKTVVSVRNNRPKPTSVKLEKK